MLAGPEIYNCDACAKNPALKIILGCHGQPPTKQLWDRNLITDAPLTCCPLRTIKEAPAVVVAEVDRYVTTYYPAYQAGHLLVEGGIADQPARYLEYVQLIGAYERRVQAKKDAIDAKQAGTG